MYFVLNPLFGSLFFLSGFGLHKIPSRYQCPAAQLTAMASRALLWAPIASASWLYLILTQRHFMLLTQSEKSF